MRRSIMAFAMLAPLTAEPGSAEPIVLKPASAWNLDIGENRCRLNRLFGEEGNQHLLALEQYYPSEGAGVFIAGPGLKPFRSGAPTQLRLFAEQTPLTSSPFTGTAEGFGPAVVYRSLRFDGETPSELPLQDLEGRGIAHLAPPPPQARSLTVAQGETSVTLETGPLASALAALNQCSEDLIYSWGLDLEQHRTATRRTVFLNGQNVSNAMAERFPSDLARAEGQAIVRLRVIVSAEGKVENCLLLNQTSRPKAAAPACKAMDKARFEPALDAQGQPMRSYYATTVTYETHTYNW